MLMALVVDDHTFNVDQKLPAEDRAPVTYPNMLPETFTKYAGRAGVTLRVPWGAGGQRSSLSVLAGQVPAGAAHGL